MNEGLICEPAARVVFVVERARVQDMLDGIQHGRVVELVAPVVFAG